MSFEQCEHIWETTSNYYGDYINNISRGKHIYRSRQICIKCHKARYSLFLDPKCKRINDGYYQPLKSKKDMR